MAIDPPDSLLEVEELKHLALKAMNGNKDEDAIRFLKQAIALAPERGELHYLLGAMHAQIGMLERAIEEVTRATALAPDLHAARFQLGLLHFSSRDFEQAKQTWKPLLDSLEEDDPLRLFAAGLIELGYDRFEDCIAMLRRGIALCASEALNADMRRVITEAEKALAGQVAAAGAPSSMLASSAEPQHILLAGYQQPPGKKPS